MKAFRSKNKCQAIAAQPHAMASEIEDLVAETLLYDRLEISPLATSNQILRAYYK